MLEYPSIQHEVVSGRPVFVFDKLDGSLVRAEWTKKRGLYKFGRKNGLLDDQVPVLRDHAVPLMQALDADLTRIFAKQRWDRAVAFFEFTGSKSFAGWHDTDDTYSVHLIDVAVNNEFLPSKQFVKLFEDAVPTARLLYHGNFTVPLKEEISAGQLEGMTFEGVVAKGEPLKRGGLPLMFKWKSLPWLQKLRCVCSSDEEYERRR